MSFTQDRLFALAALLLALLAAAELLWPAPPAPALPGLQSARPDGDAAAPPAGAPGWAAQILARPLFRPGRRPPALAVDEAAPLPRLTAIMVTPQGSLAVFAASGGQPVVLGTGGQVAGLRILAITPDHVIITSPAGTQTLSPQFDQAGVGPPSGAAAQAVPPLAPLQDHY